MRISRGRAARPAPPPAVREEILASTARLIANPVAHKLKAAEVDTLVDKIRGLTP